MSAIEINKLLIDLKKNMKEFGLFPHVDDEKRWSFLWVGSEDEAAFLGIKFNSNRTLFCVRKFTPSDMPGIWVCELVEPRIDILDVFEFLLKYKIKSLTYDDSEAKVG